MNQELKQQIVERCKKAGACQTEYKRLLTAKDTPDFLRVLINNYLWCVDSGIYTADELQSLPEEMLTGADILCQKNNPIDFTREIELIGLAFDPLNIGATVDSQYGKYFNWDEALVEAEKTGARLCTTEEYCKLLELPKKFGVYGDAFGLVFDGRLFLPAAGRRLTNGATYNVGSLGYYWSSGQLSATNAYSLHFYSSLPAGSLYVNNKLYGFSVRCVLK